MAVDEAIFRNYSVLNRPTLRIYGWDKPFVTIGYNQDKAQVLKPESIIPFVRRITGGSAILHYKEITYSLTCSDKDLNFPKSVKESYRYLCSFLKLFYERLGLKTEFAKDYFPFSCSDYQALCFSSCLDYDIVHRGRKIGGNAQRRSRNLIFQQGSIPWVIDYSSLSENFTDLVKFNNKVVSLSDLLPEEKDIFKLQALLAQSFRENFSVNMVSEVLDRLEVQKRDLLIKEKYSCDRWNNSLKMLSFS